MYDTNYEPETFIIRTRGRYYPNPRPLLQHPSAPRHIKTRSRAKYVLIVDRVTHGQSCTFAQPLANPVDPVLTAFRRTILY